VSGYLGYELWAARQDPAGEGKPVPDVAALAAQVAPTTPGIGKAALTAGGYIVPYRKVQVSPKVGGQIVELLIEEGKFVEKDALLARLDRTKYAYEERRTRALMEQAQAKLEKLRAGGREEEKKRAEAALREAEALRDQLRDEAVRLRHSVPATTPDELVKIESRVRQAEARVEMLRQEVKMMQRGRDEDIAAAAAEYEHAKVQWENAAYDLENTEVRAPVHGVILAKLAEIGDTVRPESFGQGLSASLCRMADLKTLEVDVDVSERDLEQVYVGQPCELYAEAFPNRIYKGKVARLMPESNRSKASVPVRVAIEVPDNDQILRPEMRARVAFLNKAKE
jgi:multidrug resistance efflux pump